MFEKIVGHESLRAYVAKAMGENRLPHTLLFSGMEGIGKALFAKMLAAKLLGCDLTRIESGNHPDFHLGRPEGKSGLYAIDRIRSLIEKDHNAPFEGNGKVFILEEAERMQPASANALLKTLEEPAPDSTFILVTSAPHELLPTILSRCVHLSFHPIPKEEIETILVGRGLDPRSAALSHGSIGKALELAQNPKLEEMRKILFTALSMRGNILEVSKSISELEKRVEEEEDPIRHNHLVEHLFSLILIWSRDQEVKSLGLDEYLFFPGESHLGPIQEIEKKIDQARLAFQRNIKLSAILENLLI